MTKGTGRVAIVTGSAAGIGRAAALAFGARGDRVVGADVDGDRGEAVVEEIRSRGGEAIFVRTDVSDPEQVRRLVGTTMETYGRLDYAFNNAGIEGTPAATVDCSDDNWGRTLAINLTGTWYCMREQIPRMLEGGGGVIVNMASIAGLKGYANIPAYVASKHGVVGLTKTAALEYAAQNVRINVVCPGVIETEMVARFTGQDAEAMAQMGRGQPIGRMGRPEEIADPVLWLCSEASSFVTGVAIPLDGGVMAG